MVSESKTDVFSSMSSVAVLSRVGGLVVLVVVLEVVGTPKQCLYVRLRLAEVFLLQPVQEDLVAVSVADSAEPHEEEDLEEASVAVIDQTSVEAAEASVTKAEVDLVGEVGMEVVLLMAMVMAQLHPLMLLLVPEEEAALVVGMVVPQPMVV